MKKKTDVVFACALSIATLGFGTFDNSVMAQDEFQAVLATSEDFTVRCYRDGPPATRVLKLCESLRGELGRVWCGNESLPRWQPRCEIVLHQSRHAYIQSVGPAGAQTTGSSFIQIDAGRTLARRIDLLVEPGGTLSALPHELTHIVLSDRFGARQPPHWLDEGAALLADTRHKQSLHERDCREVLHRGSAIPLGQLLCLEQFTSPEQMPAFYGQSASLMRFLCDRGDINKVTQFGMDALRDGYDRALSVHYGIGDVAELERQWKSFVYERPAASLLAADVLKVSFSP